MNSYEASIKRLYFINVQWVSYVVVIPDFFARSNSFGRARIIYIKTYPSEICAKGSGCGLDEFEDEVNGITKVFAMKREEWNDI